MADIAGFKKGIDRSNEVVDIQILDEYNEPYRAADGSAATVGIVGVDSRLFKSNYEAYSKHVSQLPKAEQKKVDWRRVSAACGIARWAGWEADGSAFPHSFENALLFVEPNHVVSQIETGVEGHARFFVKPSTS